MPGRVRTIRTCGRGVRQDHIGEQSGSRSRCRRSAPVIHAGLVQENPVTRGQLAGWGGQTCHLPLPKAALTHVFRVMKRPLGYAQTRYRGLNRSAAQVLTLIGMINIHLKRHALMTRRARCTRKPLQRAEITLWNRELGSLKAIFDP